MKILFLDVDGCLNSEDYAVYRYVTKKFDTDQFVDERAVAFLNYIIGQTQAKVVLSSSWRGDWINAEKRLKNNGFDYSIYDITPYDPTSFRGKEIKMWIDKYEKDHEPLESYVILDDDNDMLDEQRNNFVRCNFIHGLTSHDCYKAIEILNSNGTTGA